MRFTSVSIYQYDKSREHLSEKIEEKFELIAI